VYLASQTDIPLVLSVGFENLLKSANFTPEMKLELFPIAKNSILLRIENIADTFNSNGELIYQSIDMDILTEGLYYLANKKYPSKVSVVETSLTGNQSF
jgi:hypothetical protein